MRFARLSCRVKSKRLGPARRELPVVAEPGRVRDSFVFRLA